MDVDAIPLGVDFRVHINKVLAAADVVLVLIGPEWLGRSEAGASRMSDETDPVRVEVETALSLGIAVIPLLVEGASMPSEGDFPESIRALAYRNAATIDSGRDFHQHVDRIIRSLDDSKKGAVADPGIANNLPAGLPPLIGRERELGEIKAALAQSTLLTLTGSGGVGKTRIALQCAADTMRGHEHGAWFVNLAPITDGKLVAATILAALNAGDAKTDDEVAALLEYLRTRDALILLDNCEQIVAEVTSIVAQIRAKCRRITILATSRELLHLNDEQVYRLGPLRPEAAAELFSQRASAISPGFDAKGSAQVVAGICERLDGIPLAIELAAARVRVLSTGEILERLSERFRLLTGGARTALPRQQTLAATIEWSYDLLTAEEQSVLRRVSAFRGSFSLPAATAVCAQNGEGDEFHVLDMLASLIDKSLLTATQALATRYRLLETIREFAIARAGEKGDAVVAAQQHAGYFAAVAAQAYREFDSQMPGGWLQRLAPDIDNLRAALEWSLEGPGDRQVGAQLAADCGPIFLRSSMLGEGLRWCDRARAVADLPAHTAGRIDYVASMMHNNLGANRLALACAESAVSYYRQSSDERGTIRALSQVAQQYARNERFDEARAPAAEAIERARRLCEPRVLVSVLRRCAFSLPTAEIEDARRYFSEALEAARSVREPEEACMVLQWWAICESAAGSFERAIALAEEGLQCADRHARMYLENQIACWALALGRLDESAPHAREALLLALEVPHPLARAEAIAFYSPVHAAHDPKTAAMLLGYAKARLGELEWEARSEDDLALHNASQAIESGLRDGEFASLLEAGAAWTEVEALGSLAESPVSREPVGS